MKPFGDFPSVAEPGAAPDRGAVARTITEEDGADLHVANADPARREGKTLVSGRPADYLVLLSTFGGSGSVLSQLECGVWPPLTAETPVVRRSPASCRRQ